MSDPWASPADPWAAPSGEQRPAPGYGQVPYGQPPAPVQSRRVARPAVEVPSVRGRDVAWTLTAFAAGGLVPVLLVVVLARILGLGRYSFSAAMVAAAVGCWVALWWVLLRRLKWGVRQLGFVRARRSGWHLLWQVPLSITASATAAATLGSALGLGSADAAAERDASVALDAGVGGALMVGLVVILVVPAAEEVVFRRVLLDWLRSRVPLAAAVGVAAVVFALFHVAPVIMVYVVWLGALLGAMRVWYGSLWPPLVLHAANNALVTAIAVAALT